MIKKAEILTALFAVLGLCTAAHGRTITVDNDGPADFNNIQAAIDDSNNGDTIIVSDGTYTGYGNRDIDFLGKEITLRSVNGPEHCIIDCNGTESEPHRGFYFHNGEDSNSVLHGLTITNGYGPNNGDLFSHGGAIYCIGASPTISHCTFTGNWAEFGGGIECRQSNACILNSIFTDNFANSWGGGLCFREGNPIISHCIISNNTSVREGGGIDYGGNQNPTISHCIISDNSSVTDGGGGISLFFGIGTTAARISNCKISRNSADYSGGGIRLHGPLTHGALPNVTITNCIIMENSDEYSGGGGIACWGGNLLVNNCTISANTIGQSKVGSGIYCDASNVRITNSVLWSPIYGCEIVLFFTLVGLPGHTFLEILNSDVDGGQAEVYVGPYDCTLNWGVGNINADPCFSDPCNGDYHLKSQAGRFDANNESWVQDDVTSPCIDAGNPHNPIGREPFPNGGLINMGAYGGTEEASKSYFGKPPCEIIVAGDVNGDCVVNFLDFRLMALHWLEDSNSHSPPPFPPPPPPPPDGCMKTGAPEYPAWEQWDKPPCWCYARQCRGDADGIKTGPFWVAIPDLNAFRAAFNKSDTVLQGVPYGICSDFDHVKTGPFRIAIPDLNIFRQYFNKIEALVPECDPTDYNYWVTP
jgi:hypothetical protein